MEWTQIYRVRVYLRPNTIDDIELHAADRKTALVKAQEEAMSRHPATTFYGAEIIYAAQRAVA
jgi:1,2-phenylacetyl-CoA epoxidase PaaB subunit